MTDPDDVNAIMLDHAIREMLEACESLSDPRKGVQEFLYWTIAVLVTGQWDGRSMDSLLLCVARRVTTDIYSSL